MSAIPRLFGVTATVVPAGFSVSFGTLRFNVEPGFGTYWCGRFNYGGIPIDRLFTADSPQEVARALESAALKFLADTDILRAHTKAFCTPRADIVTGGRKPISSSFPACRPDGTEPPISASMPRCDSGVCGAAEHPQSIQHVANQGKL